MSLRMSRRGFLTATAGTIGAVAAQPLLAACGTGGAPATTGAASLPVKNRSIFLHHPHQSARNSTQPAFPAGSDASAVR